MGGTSFPTYSSRDGTVYAGYNSNNGGWVQGPLAVTADGRGVGIRERTVVTTGSSPALANLAEREGRVRELLRKGFSSRDFGSETWNRFTNEGLPNPTYRPPLTAAQSLAARNASAHEAERKLQRYSDVFVHLSPQQQAESRRATQTYNSWGRPERR